MRFPGRRQARNEIGPPRRNGLKLHVKVRRSRDRCQKLRDTLFTCARISRRQKRRVDAGQRNQFAQQLLGFGCSAGHARQRLCRAFGSVEPESSSRIQEPLQRRLVATRACRYRGTVERKRLWGAAFTPFRSGGWKIHSENRSSGDGNIAASAQLRFPGSYRKRQFRFCVGRFALVAIIGGDANPVLAGCLAVE